ncbi:DNRLRE domain-containing protein [Egicoccus halophilus]|uniref:DNRLRE domain-containing protein n=1 Tax=Egicoccus halophilus TaxID=1670830 RepID=UPI00102F70B3|nr:DNRLRE domain-containing protein [Egicoccus halophilus]
MLVVRVRGPLVVLLIWALVAAVAPVAAVAQPVDAEMEVSESVAAEPESPVASGAVVPVREDALAASLSAVGSGQRVLVESATSETSQTFANPDGTFTDEVHFGPQRVFDVEAGDAGAWREIDTRLQRSEGAVVPRVTAAEVSFSAGGVGPMVELGDGEGQGVTFDWSGLSLPSPELDGNVARYRQVQPGLDLELEALPAGYAKRLVLHERPAAPVTWRFEVSAERLEVVEPAEGGLELVDADDEAVIVVDGLYMWGAERNEQADEPARVAEVEHRLVRRGGRTVLEITPDFGFLSDPQVQLPITIDPTASLAIAQDTFVQSNLASTPQASATELRVGTYDGGTSRARTLIQFDPAPLAGKDVESASLQLYNFHSWSCTARQVNVRRLSAPFNSSTTWSNQPASPSTVYASASFARGHSSACAAGWASFDVTDRVRQWVNGETNNGLMLLAADETDNAGWKKFYSSEHATGSQRPKLTVTYNTYPNLVAGRASDDSQFSTGTVAYVPTLTPMLRGTFCDGDAGTSGRVVFEVFDATKSTRVATVNGNSGVSCHSSTGRVPAGVLSDGQSYYWRARGFDGKLYSREYSSWIHLVPDVTRPITPRISSTTHEVATESDVTSVAFDWTVSTDGNNGSGVAGYAVEFDQDRWTTPSGPLQTATSFAKANVEGGIWWLHVRARDRVGNWSTIRRFQVNISAGSLVAPETGDRTQRRMVLQAMGPVRLSTATFQWRRSDSDAWTTVPAARLALASSPSVPLTSSVQPLSEQMAGEAAGRYRTSRELVWDLAATVGSVDGPVQVRALFDDGSASKVAKVTLDQLGAGKDYGTVPLGPGQANLLTGNFSMTDADVSVTGTTTDLTVTRSYNSRADLTQIDPLFGAGWTSGVPVLDAGAGFRLLETPEHASASTPAPFVVVEDVEGAEFWFDTPEAHDGGHRYQAVEAGFEDLTLTHRGSQYVLSDLDGMQVTFRSHEAESFVPEVVKHTPDAAATSITYSRIGGMLRPTTLRAPGPAGAACGQPGPGCRALHLVYDPPNASTSRLQSVQLETWDAANTRAVRDVLVSYEYDAARRLVGVVDPRTGTTRSTQLATTFGYAGSTARLTTLTPPGVEPWTLVYAASSGPEAGRLQAVERAEPGSGVNRWTLVYDVPRTGSGAPHPMGDTELDRWGQAGRNLPTDVTAVFPPEQVPSSTSAASLTAAGYARAEVHYLDRNGRSVNVASPGGRISVTEHDVYGNVVRELTPANRAQALTEPDTQAAAGLLATVRLFDASGLRLERELGPQHQVQLSNGELQLARRHTRHHYPQIPTADGSDTETATLPTSSWVGALLTSGQVVDEQLTQTEYDWKLRLATRQTLDPDGLGLVTVTRYDDEGREIERRQPSEADGGGPGTLRTVRYTAPANPTYPQCGGRPDWHGQVCLITPAAQPAMASGLPGLATIHTAGYNRLLQPTQVAESVPRAGGGTTVRTTTTSYDTAGRVTRVAVTAGAGSTIGTAVAETTTVYDPATGAVSETRSDGRTLVRSYDRLGRLTSYTDSVGTHGQTRYDRFGRVASVGDGLGTRSFTYDDTTGYTTAVTDSQVGSFTASVSDYDGDGTLRRWTTPAGWRHQTTLDPAGNPVGQQITQTRNCGPGGCLSFDEHVTVDIHGRWVAHVRAGMARSYRYDGAGRLITATDAGAACQIREYAFDGAAGANANRSSKAVTRAGADGNCDLDTRTTTDYAYDQADRLLSGTVYDGLGRTTRVPAGLLEGHGQLDATYYANDLVHSLTQNGQRRTYTLDPAMRFASETRQDGTTDRWRYADDTDAPAWIDHPGLGWTRHVTGITGDLAATITSPDGATTTITEQLTDLFGSVIANVGNDPQAAIPGTTVLATSITDEYGAPLDTTTITGRYHWLGGKQRAAVLASGAILMGVRAYLPQLGRFLQIDPVIGGSASAYDYCYADPINCTDLDGKRARWSRLVGRWYRGIRRTGHVVRAARNTPFTAGAYLWGRAWGGTCTRQRGLMITCTGMRGGHARGGTQVGNVFLTRDRSVSPSLLRHESRHATQWAVMGFAFPLAYLAGGTNPCRNWAERQAGLKAGNYDWC